MTARKLFSPERVNFSCLQRLGSNSAAALYSLFLLPSPPNHKKYIFPGTEGRSLRRQRRAAVLVPAPG